MTLGNLGNLLNLCALATLSPELARRVPIHKVVKINIVGAYKTMCLVHSAKKVGETSCYISNRNGATEVTIV